MRGAALSALVLVAACEGPLSTLAPAGRDAERIALLWWWMAAGAAVIWIAFTVIMIAAVRVGPSEDGDETRGIGLVVWAGAVIPTAVLGVLLAFGLALLPDVRAPGDPDGLRIHVTGEEFWWRVRYEPPDGDPVESANELHLPVGRRVELTLESADVIHSFWIPSLGGKMDMVPGRVTRMALEPTRTGVFGGACAEFCGDSHAFMTLTAVVQEPEAFDAWLERERAPAPVPPDASPTASRGAAAFVESGCGACHTIRGTPANGRVGPDLTHVGGRRSLAAGAATNDAPGFARWIADPAGMKPGVHMPGYDMLSDEDLRALAVYLDGLP